MDTFKKNLNYHISLSEYAGSLRSLSIASGLQPSYLSNLLNGNGLGKTKAGPGILNINKICKTLGITLDDLFKESEVSPPRIEDLLKCRN